MPSDARPFVGTANPPVFEFSRRVRLRNDFRPFVIGRVRPVEGGAVFEAVVRPALDALFVLLLALVVFGAVAVDGMLYPSGRGSPVAVFVLVLLFVGAIVASYVDEQRKAEQILREAFDRVGAAAPQNVP